jgi:hypothetical protein
MKVTKGGMVGRDCDFGVTFDVASSFFYSANNTKKFLVVGRVICVSGQNYLSEIGKWAEVAHKNIFEIIQHLEQFC